MGASAGILIMRHILLVVGLTIAVGVVVARYADKIVGKRDHSDALTAAPTALTPPPELQPSSTSPSTSKPTLPTVITLSRSVTLNGDGRGHFKVEARVDGRRIDFMLDTGATAVALRASTAAQLGIHPAPRDYTVRVQTANGEIRAAPVRLNMVEVGGIIVRDVPAVVQSDETLPMNLLGMTFLSRVRWTHDRGKLVLEQ